MTPLRSALAAALLAACAAGAGAAEVDDVRALLARGDAAAALPRARALAEANPGDAQARFLHGVALMDSGRDGDALALFTELAQLFPELPDPLNNIALIEARAGRLDAALAALRTALRNDPQHRTARANLGLVHLMLAVQAWEQAAAAGAVEPALQRRLEGARSLLAAR